MCRVQESLYILAVCVRTRGKDTRMGMRVDMCMGHVHRHGHGHVCRRVPLMSGLAMCAAHVWEPVRCGFSEIRQYNSGLHSCGLYAIVVWPIFFLGTGAVWHLRDSQAATTRAPSAQGMPAALPVDLLPA